MVSRTAPPSPGAHSGPPSAGRLSTRIRDAVPSATVRIADVASEMRRRGVSIVDFSAGRAAEHTPPYVVDTAVSALRSGDTHQTPARGTPEYRAAVARKLARENGIDADPETEIIASLGCKQGLTLSLLATLDAGDEVLIEDPAFVSYAPTIRFCGGVPVPVRLREENGYRWTRDDLEAALTPRTRAILFCSPHNPTGVVHSVPDLDEIAHVAREHDLWVVSDEIYERMTWGGRRHVCMATRPDMRARSITLMGLTKSFAMGGWRIGFVHAPPAVISGMVTLQQHLMTCAGSFTQAGAARALGDEPDASVVAMWREWEARCGYMTSGLDGIPGVRCSMPEAGYYGWADVRAFGVPVADLAEQLLVRHAVAVVPGSAFGPAGEGFLRITCVRSRPELELGLERIAAALHEIAPDVRG